MPRIVFQGANLLDGHNAPRQNASVVVEGERIVAVGESVSLRPDDQLLDLEGRSLLPGLTTCHFHSTYRDIAAQAEPLGLEGPPVYLGLIAADHLGQALRSGFTGVVSAGAIPADIDAQCKLAIESGVIEGPRLIPGSRGLDTVAASTDTERWWWNLGNAGAQRLVSGADGFRDAVRDEVKRGAEMIKLFPTSGHAGYPGRPGTRGRMSLTREELHSAVDTAHQLGVKIRAHCVWKSAMRECIEAGVDVIDHGDELDQEIIDLMAEHGTFLVPSMFFVHTLLQDAGPLGPDAQDMTSVRADLENMKEWLPRANEAGVKICCGDDYGIIVLPHGDYAAELEFYAKQIGIPPLDVLRWATVHGADLMGQGAGSIREGSLADLIVVDGDPSVDLSLLRNRENLRAIMKGGGFVLNELSCRIRQRE